MIENYQRRFGRGKASNRRSLHQSFSGFKGWSSMRFVARTRILGYIFDLLFFVWLGGDPGKEVENERHEGGERERTKFPGARG